MKNGIVAFRDGEVSQIAAEALGSVVLWDLSREIDVHVTKARWAAAALPPAWAIDPITPSVALSRAVGELRERHRFVRSIPHGWAIVAEEARGDNLHFDVELRVIVDRFGALQFDPPDHREAEQVRASSRQHADRVGATDIGRWLCRLAAHCDAVPMRSNGGCYFIPAHSLDLWRRICAVIHEVSDCVIHDIPAMHCDSAIDAVLNHLSAEAAQAATAVLAEISANNLGPRALASRQRETLKLAAKVERYEALLGVSLQGVRDNLERLNAAITAAAFAAAAAAEDTER
jgi:hypothetical protein